MTLPPRASRPQTTEAAADTEAADDSEAQPGDDKS